MNISVSAFDGILIVKVSGDVNRQTAGRLYDTMVKCVGDGTTSLIVDLSGVHFITHAGVRGLIVAARLIKPGRGAMRVCGAAPAIEDFLQGLGFSHLLKCDPTVEASVAALSERTGRTATALVATTPKTLFGAPVTSRATDSVAPIPDAAMALTVAAGRR